VLLIAAVLIGIVALTVAGTFGYRYFKAVVGRNDDGDRTVRTEIEGQRLRLDLPTSGDVEHVAIWFHGQGADENARMNEPWLNALRADGWAVASSQFHTSSWGSGASVDDTISLTEWMRTETGVTPTLWIAGSMGGAVSLNTMIHTDVEPECWYGTMPVVDLDSVSEVPGATDEITAVWGDAVPSE